jgi:hypothetical protein
VDFRLERCDRGSFVNGIRFQAGFRDYTARSRDYTTRSRGQRDIATRFKNK